MQLFNNKEDKNLRVLNLSGDRIVGECKKCKKIHSVLIKNTRKIDLLYSLIVPVTCSCGASITQAIDLTRQNKRKDLSKKDDNKAVGVIVTIGILILLAVACNSGSGSSSDPCREAGFSKADCEAGKRELEKMR